MPDAEMAIVPGSHGGFHRIDELNDGIAALIKARNGWEDVPTEPELRRCRGEVPTATV
jgi:hypothetical protein